MASQLDKLVVKGSSKMFLQKKRRYNKISKRCDICCLIAKGADFVRLPLHGRRCAACLHTKCDQNIVIQLQMGGTKRKQFYFTMKSGKNYIF